MLKFKISNQDLQKVISGKSPEFPKYSTQIMNLANANAQGTRPSVVGQMSDLIQEFPGKTLEEWEDWYKKKQPNAIRDATEKIYQMVTNLQPVIHQIDKNVYSAPIRAPIPVQFRHLFRCNSGHHSGPFRAPSNA